MASSKLQKHKRYGLRFSLVGVSILAVVLLWGALEATGVIHFVHKSPTSAQKQQDADAAKKKAFTSNQNGKDSGAATQGTYSPPTSSNGITLSAAQSGSQVVVTTKLSGYSDGTCTLTISNGSKITTQTAQVIYQPQFSTCAGFSVPVSSAGSGNWDIGLSVLSGGVTTAKSITFEAK